MSDCTSKIGIERGNPTDHAEGLYGAVVGLLRHVREAERYTEALVAKNKILQSLAKSAIRTKDEIASAIHGDCMYCRFYTRASGCSKDDCNKGERWEFGKEGQGK